MSAIQIPEKFTKYSAYVPSFSFTSIDKMIIRKAYDFCCATLFLTHSTTKNIPQKDIDFCFNSILRHYFKELFQYDITDRRLKSYYQANLLEHMITAVLTYRKYPGHMDFAYENALNVVFIYIRKFIETFKTLYGSDVPDGSVSCNSGMSSEECFKQMLFLNKEYYDGKLSKEKFLEEFASVCFFFKERRYVPLGDF